MSTFSGRMFLNGKEYAGQGVICAVAIGYEPVPAEERLPALATLDGALGEKLSLEDERQQRVDLQYRLGCLREVSRVMGPPCEYMGLKKGLKMDVVHGKQVEITSSFYGPVEVPEKGEGSVHYVGFQLVTSGGNRRVPDGITLEASDLAKIDQGDIPGFALHFEVK